MPFFVPFLLKKSNLKGPCSGKERRPKRPPLCLAKLCLLGVGHRRGMIIPQQHHSFKYDTPARPPACLRAGLILCSLKGLGLVLI